MNAARLLATWLLALACSVGTILAAAPASAAPTPAALPPLSAADQQRADKLAHGLRCLVCQNESIDDSNAELAADLRRLVREEIKAGRTDDEVRKYLTDRYGEFVLLKPAFSWGNAMLWGAPLLVVLAGLLLLVRNFRNRVEADELTPDEVERLNRLSRD